MGAGGRAARWQMARIAAGSALPMLRRGLARLGEIAFGLRAWVAFALLAPLGWLACVLAPSRRAAWSAGGAFARALLRATGTPLRVDGLERLPRDRACVLAVNHASYLDGVIMVAVLPGDYAFVAKRELLGNWVARVFLQSLGAIFVERFDAHQSVRDAERLEGAAREGRSLLFFPEGTFRRAPGILPFRLGAFVVAANSGAEVVPVALRGTRAVLPGDRLIASRGAIEVVIGAPVSPRAEAATAFEAAISLRDAARAHIVAHAGEPDLDASPSPALQASPPARP